MFKVDGVVKFYFQNLWKCKIDFWNFWIGKIFVLRLLELEYGFIKVYYNFFIYKIAVALQLTFQNWWVLKCCLIKFGYLGCRNFLVDYLGDDHEVEFHEIEIAIFHEIEITIMRSKLG